MDVMELTTRKAWVRDEVAGCVRIWDADPRSVKAARDWARDRARAAGAPHLDDIWEVTSELATNALVHACPMSVPCFAVRLEARADYCVVDVIDRYTARVPAVRSGDQMSLGGRGMNLVSAQASAWTAFTPCISKVPPQFVKVVRAVFYSS